MYKAPLLLKLKYAIQLLETSILKVQSVWFFLESCGALNTQLPHDANILKELDEPQDQRHNTEILTPNFFERNQTTLVWRRC